MEECKQFLFEMYLHTNWAPMLLSTKKRKTERNNIGICCVDILRLTFSWFLSRMDLDLGTPLIDYAA